MITMNEETPPTPDESDLYDEYLTAGNEYANLHAPELLDQIAALSTMETGDFDFGTAVYGYWVYITRELVTQGWTPDELARDAKWHATIQQAATEA